MTVTWMTARDKDSICPASKGVKYHIWAYPPGARNPYNSNGWRILVTAYPGKISPGITAPVTQKGNYLWLPVFFPLFFHNRTYSSNAASTAAIICSFPRFFRVMASDLQPATHAPQPLQRAVSTTAFPVFSSMPTA